MDSLPDQSFWIEIDKESGTISPIGGGKYNNMINVNNAKLFLEKLTKKLPRIVSKPIVVQHEQMTNEKFTLFVDERPVHVFTNANANTHTTTSRGAHHDRTDELRTKKVAASNVNGDNESVPFIDADYKGLDKNIKDPIFRAIARAKRDRNG